MCQHVSIVTLLSVAMVTLLTMPTQAGKVLSLVYTEPNVYDIGAWTSWFNEDSPTGDGWGDPLQGDKETLHLIDWAKEFDCTRSVPCRSPVAMEIDLSDEHKKLYPKADLREVLNCTFLRRHARDPTTGFFCVNTDQADTTWGDWCLQRCQQNGQVNTYRPTPTPVCNRCADFKVRYFCLNADYRCGNTEDDIFHRSDPSRQKEEGAHAGVGGGKHRRRRSIARRTLRDILQNKQTLYEEK